MILHEFLRSLQALLILYLVLGFLELARDLSPLELLQAIPELHNDRLEFALHGSVVFYLFVHARTDVLSIAPQIAQLFRLGLKLLFETYFDFQELLDLCI